MVSNKKILTSLRFLGTPRKSKNANVPTKAQPKSTPYSTILSCLATKNQKGLF